jgi:regulator of RNase E activity RraA
MTAGSPRSRRRHDDGPPAHRGVPGTVIDGVRPGDLLIGDADGVLAVPVAIAEQVAEVCAQVSGRPGQR